VARVIGFGFSGAMKAQKFFSSSFFTVSTNPLVMGLMLSPFNHENALRFGRSFNKLLNMTYFSLKREKTTRKKILGFHGT